MPREVCTSHRKWNKYTAFPSREVGNRERDIWLEVYMNSEFCVVMGFMISGNGGIEQYEHKWWFWKMNWKILLHSFVILEVETNKRKRTYRQAECCKESQSKECLHCRCCQKMQNWRQLHVGPVYTQNIWQCHQKILLTKPSTSDKRDFDLSRLDFNISKMTRLFVLRNIQTFSQVILIFNYVSFYCKIADKRKWCLF